MPKLFIYGAGKLGTALYHFCKDVFGGATLAFVETHPLQKHTPEGVPIFSVQEVCYDAKNVLIFLAIGSAAARRMVRLKLLSYHVPAGRIIDASEFILDNNLERNKDEYCILCNHYVSEFLSGGAVMGGIFERSHIIGGGWRKNWQCPECGCVDRVRWVYYVLCNHTDIFERPCNILHFAPEAAISQRILEAQPASAYFPVDIAPGNGICRVDMTAIPFSDGTFDYVIANHVLEHIIEEEKALSELKRVIKLDGSIILSFPICADRNTYEDRAIVNPEERLKAYGQEDHVRLYGRDYLERIKSFGFDVSVYTPKECCTMDEVERYGFIEDDVSLVCRRSKR